MTGFTDTWMNFSGPVTGRARVDVAHWENTNMSLERHDLRLRDARPLIGDLSLDTHGFTLVQDKSPFRRTPRPLSSPSADTEIDPDAAARYQSEVAGTLAGLTGASLVLPQGKGLLKRVNAEGAIGPSRWVHMDYTTDAAHTWVRWLEGWEGRPLRQYPRFAVLQTWRCLTPPPCDNTLALCDATSADPGDRIVFDACMREPYDEPGNQFESQFARFNPDQDWFYFDGLTPDEMIVFKGFDSDPARDARPLHNSIDLPAPGAAPRVSVEARFFAFFDA